MKEDTGLNFPDPKCAGLPLHPVLLQPLLDQVLDAQRYWAQILGQHLVPPLSMLSTSYVEETAKMRAIDLLGQAHWLAHPALPVYDLLVGEDELPEVGRLVEAYVTEHPDEIYACLRARFESYALDQATHRFALELVEAHRRQLFSLIVPAVFPEIERCARGVLGEREKSAANIIKELNKRIGNLLVPDFNSLEALAVYDRMEDYFYQSTKSIRNISDYQNIIHRHATLHGLLRYNQSRDGLNAIFLFDFVLLACDVLKKNCRP
jgi:hypothetical protein